MRYIGGKTLLTSRIIDTIVNNTTDVRTVTDIFAGSGAVSQALKQAGYSTTANDVLYFSYVLNKGILCNNRTTRKIRELIAHLNALPINQADPNDPHNFIAHNYTLNDTCNRMYFQHDNALKIDIIRQEIEHLRPELTENEYFYLLASLIAAVPFVANITGTYAAYLKYWDIRTYKTLTLEELPINPSHQLCRAYNMQAEELATHIHSDLVYLDPPYNSREYLPNYHILETIARYDYPKISGVTGTRPNTTKSDFCKKARVHEAFNNLLQNLNTRYILISYNNEGLIPTAELSDIVRANGKPDTFRLFEFPYRRYKSKIPNNAEGLQEQLYFIQKR